MLIIEIWKPYYSKPYFLSTGGWVNKSYPSCTSWNWWYTLWPWTTNGFYTCKSRYWFLKEENELRHSVEDKQEKHLWKGIWSLHLPNKVKKILCRACQNSLPTKQNLGCRTVITDPHCDRCCVAVENTLHALWSCPMLDSVWVATDFWTCRSSRQFLDFRELLGWILQMQKLPELLVFTV